MATLDTAKALEQLASLGEKTSDPAVKELTRVLGDSITVGNISNATGVAVGRNIRQVVNNFNLPVEAAAALLDLRAMLGATLGVDAQPFQWGTLIADKTKDFVGREFVFAAIEQFLDFQPNGYFTIEADPGLGKSALLAEYVRRTGCIVHFNVRALGINSAASFLQDVCAQLIADAELPYATLPKSATEDGAFLLRLINEAAAKLAPNERLVIAVDALDEVDLSRQAVGSNILFLPNTLPERVYFVLTRRPVAVPLVVQAPQELLDLMAHPAENRRDVERYLERATERPGLKSWILGQKLKARDFIARLVELSESNFMYLRYVIPEMERGAYTDLGIDRLPSGLEGYYEDHWRKMGMTAKPLPRPKIRIVYILSEVHQPVSRRLISEFATDAAILVDELTVQEVLEEWDEFLRELPNEEGLRYSIYHASFRDFLHRKDVVKAAGVTLKDINALIAGNLWDSLFRPD